MADYDFSSSLRSIFGGLAEMGARPDASPEGVKKLQDYKSTRLDLSAMTHAILAEPDFLEHVPLAFVEVVFAKPYRTYSFDRDSENARVDNFNSVTVGTNVKFGDITRFYFHVPTLGQRGSRRGVGMSPAEHRKIASILEEKTDSTNGILRWNGLQMRLAETIGEELRARIIDEAAFPQALNARIYPGLFPKR